MDDTTDEPCPYDFRPSGVVWIVLDGERCTLRRPLLGEFRRLREAHHEADLEIVQAGAAIRARLGALNERSKMLAARAMPATARAQRLHVLAKLGDEIDPARVEERDRLTAAAKAGPLTADEVKERAQVEADLRAVLSDVDDSGLEAWAGWTAQVCKELAGVDDDPGDLDPALCTAEFTVGLLDHWRHVTPPRGR